MHFKYNIVNKYMEGINNPPFSGSAVQRLKKGER